MSARPVRPDRMRRYAYRASRQQWEKDQEREYRRWLASLPEEHRAVHDTPGQIVVCAQCINEQTAGLGAMLRRAMKRVDAEVYRPTGG